MGNSLIGIEKISETEAVARYHLLMNFQSMKRSYQKFGIIELIK